MSVKASDIRYTETDLERTVEVCGTLTVGAGLPVSNQQIYEARDYDLLEVVREAIRKEIDRIVYGEVRQIAQELRRELARVLTPDTPSWRGTQTQAFDLIGRLMEAARVQPEPEAGAEGEKGAGDAHCILGGI